jgi:hypothetical protein
MEHYKRLLFVLFGHLSNLSQVKTSQASDIFPMVKET